MSCRRVFLVLLAFAPLARAQPPSEPVGAENEYVGCLTSGFEDAFFRPIADQGRVQWWITRVPDNFLTWLHSEPAQSGRREMFARVIAKVSEPGRFGHLGMGSRDIEIVEILELRRFQETDGVCQYLEPPPPPPPPESFPDL